MKHLEADQAMQVLEALGLAEEHHEEARRRLASAELFERSGEIFRAGDVAAHLYVLLHEEGQAAQHVKLASEIPSRVDPVPVMWVVESCFGEFEFVRRGRADNFPPRSLSCIAPESVKCVRIPYRALLSFEPSILAEIDRHLALVALARADRVMNRFGTAKVTSKAAQLAQTLLELGEDIGSDEGGGVRVDLKIKQQDLANEVGLTREAVNANIREWELAGVVNLSPSQLKIVDRKRFETYVLAGVETSRAAHDGYIGNVDALIAKGDNFRARNMALDGIGYFPRSVELKYRAFLAAIRTGSLVEASRLLDQVFAGVTNDSDLRSRLEESIRSGTKAKAGSGSRDTDDDDAGVEDAFNRTLPSRLNVLHEDVLAGRARLLKESALGTHRAADKSLLPQAASAYEDVYKQTHGYFTAINAASLYHLAGRSDDARRLARETATFLAKEAKTYWELVSLAEAELLLGNPVGAQKAFAQALGTAGATAGAIATTRLQLKRLAPSLGLSEVELLKLLPQSSIVVYSGHLTKTAEDMPDSVANSLQAELLRRLRAGNVSIGYGAVGAGADLIFASALLQTKATLNLLLPFHVDDFEKLSVSGRVSSLGIKKFNQALEQAGSLKVLATERLDKMRVSEHDERIWRANRQMLGLALLQADALLASVKLSVIWDGSPAQNIAGTANLVHFAKQLGVEIETLECPWRKGDPKLTAVQFSDSNLFVPVMFVWEEIEQKGKASEKRFVDSLKGGWPSPCWTDGFPKSKPRLMVTAHCFNSIGDALDAASAALHQAAKQSARVRIVCDYGPVRTERGGVDLARIKRLSGSDEGLQMPWGEAAASESFAAEVRLLINAGVKCWPAGRVFASDRVGDTRPIASLPMFQLQW